MSDSELQTLLAELHDPSNLSWKDETYSIERAADLDAAERELYIRRLIELAQHGDEKAMLSLGALKVTEAIDPLLRISQAQAERASYARRALVWLGRGQDVIADVAHDATSSQQMSVRAAAVLNLGQLGGPIATQALDACLDDVDSTVRSMAADALIELFHLQKYSLGADGTRELRTPLQRMTLLLHSAIEPLREVGKRELRAVIAALTAGATPESAGLTWSATMPESLRMQIPMALGDVEVPLPIDELSKVDGADRKWIEALLAAGMVREDARLPAALARLDARWTLPALDAVAATAEPGEFRDAVEAARRSLASSPN